MCGGEEMNPPTNWQETLDSMILWLKEDKPFCYLRFGDGEFNAMFNPNAEQVNADAHKFYPDLGEALFDVLNEISHLKEQPDNLLAGGFWCNHWGIDQEYKLKIWGFLDKIRWCPISTFIDGIVSLKTMEFLQALKESKRKKILICNETIKDAGKFIGAESIVAPVTNCWLDKDSIIKSLSDYSSPNLMIYCIGMSSEPIMWKLWKDNPDSIQIDMGHFFDYAYGVKSRAWLQKDNPRLKVYNEKYVPMIRGEE